MASDEEREKRRNRRRNRIVKDLRQGPYHQRVNRHSDDCLPDKRHKYKEPYLDEDFED